MSAVACRPVTPRLWNRFLVWVLVWVWVWVWVWVCVGVGVSVSLSCTIRRIGPPIRRNRNNTPYFVSYPVRRAQQRAGRPETWSFGTLML